MKRPTRPRLRAFRVFAVFAVLTFVGACGGKAAVLPPLPKVTAAMVPTAIASGGIKLYPKEDPDTRKAFAGGGQKTLVSDARLWELRQGDRLVGALQVATVMPKLKLAKAAHRDAVLHQILPGNVGEIDVGDTHVWVAAANDKVVYVWFGTNTFEVLQLKGSKLSPEDVLTQLLTFQSTSPAWKPLRIS
jgi:hypothetical protein